MPERTVRRFRTILARPWLLAFLPVNAATAAFGLSLQLLLIQSGRQAVLEWALASTLFNAALIASSIGWGYLADRYPLRRRFLLINYIGFAAIYASLDVLTSNVALLTLYTLVGILTPAGVSASNLLILEQFSERERPVAFGSFQEMSILGSIVGGLVGFFWLQAHELLRPLLLVLAALALASAGVVWFGLNDSRRPARIETVVRDPAGFASRVRHSVPLRISVPFFPHPPRDWSGAWRRFVRQVREETHHELPLIFAAMLLFNLSANLFNISYTFYLSAIGISFAQIFLVNVANNAVQGVAFPLSGTLATRGGPDRLVRQSTFARLTGYLAVTGFTFIPAFGAALAFGANTFVFGLLGGAIAFYSTASSLVLFRTLRDRDAGELLGVNSALGGVAAVVGASLSGVLSYFGGYRLTFLVAAVALVVSLPLWTGSDVAFTRRRFAVGAHARAGDEPGSASAPTQSD